MTKVLHPLIIIWLATVTTSCGQQYNFDWLLGHWIRTNNEGDNITYESWEKLNEKEYAGFGYTMQHSDTTWQEHVTLVSNNGKWSFNVLGKGDTVPTRFLLTQIEETHFVCENPQNPFPKKIEYRKEEDMLHATVSADDTEILFHFRKTQ